MTPPRRSTRRVLDAPTAGSSSPGPGRPKDGARREAALETTRSLLIAKGYDEVTLSEVARVAGVSRPFMYDNWGTKFALVQDAIFASGVAAEPAPLDLDDKPFEEAMSALISAMVSIQNDPAYLAGLPGLSAELYRRPDLVDEIELKYIAPLRHAYVKLVDRGKAEGIVRADADGSALLDSLRGAVMLHTLVNPSLKPAELIDHLRTLILYGIAVH